MNWKLIVALIVPGLLLGSLITLGVLQNLFFVTVLWLLIVILYPLLVVAGGQENYAVQAFAAVYICGTMITWIPVMQYVSFVAHNPEQLYLLNDVYRHPRRMLFALGQLVAFGGGIVSLIIAVLFVRYLKYSYTH